MVSGKTSWLITTHHSLLTRVETMGIEPISGCLQGILAALVHASPSSQLGRWDSNPHGPVPKTGGLPIIQRPRAPSGSRTRTSNMASWQAAATSWVRCGLVVSRSQAGAKPQANHDRVGGTRTLTSSLKRRVRCRYATTLRNRDATFMSKQACHDCSSPTSSPGRNCTSHRRLIRPQCSSYNTGPTYGPLAGREALESSYPAFQTGARPSQLPTQ